jgi:RNA polymerase sigma factor (sigma-70 family)
MPGEASPDNIPPWRYPDYLLWMACNPPAPQPPAEPGLSGGAGQVPPEAGRANGSNERQLAAWLRRILAGTLADATRSQGRDERSLKQVLEETVERRGVSAAGGGPRPEEAAVRNEQLLRFAEALARLPEDQRAVLEMKHLQGLSVADICQRTGRTKFAVAELIYRGVRALRAQLDEPGGPAGR